MCFIGQLPTNWISCLGIGAADNQTEQVLNDTFSYHNVQYKLILNNLTWNDAMAACIGQKMQLVSITDQFQQASLAVQAALHDYPLWIGLFSRDVSFIIPLYCGLRLFLKLYEIATGIKKCRNEFGDSF